MQLRLSGWKRRIEHEVKLSSLEYFNRSTDATFKILTQSDFKGTTIKKKRIENIGNRPLNKAENGEGGWLKWPTGFFSLLQLTSPCARHCTPPSKTSYKAAFTSVDTTLETMNLNHCKSPM